MALEACCGVPSPIGCRTCDKTFYQPGGLVTEPSGVRLCSGSSMLHLLQSWSPSEVPRLSWGTCSGVSVPEVVSLSRGPCPGLCVQCVTVCVPTAAAAPGV